MYFGNDAKLRLNILRLNGDRKFYNRFSRLCLAITSFVTKAISSDELDKRVAKQQACDEWKYHISSSVTHANLYERILISTCANTVEFKDMLMIMSRTYRPTNIELYTKVIS